ncbi:MAG TPA: hypothetical protein VM388_06265 [Acidimicrobiales bacterium]|nr:hypothetical protein [Acidimicrobiales bacterium]
MAAVSVFVDDAIRGDLPLVCAKTGEPADLRVRVRQPVGGGFPLVVWFLLFLGPLGIVALVVAALLSPPPEYLTVRIPETGESFGRERQMERWRLAALGAGVGLPFLGIVGVGMFPLLWVGAGLGCWVVAGALTWMLWRQSIGVSIDVSRRWVTFSGVHPAFAEAVARQEVASSQR